MRSASPFEFTPRAIEEIREAQAAYEHHRGRQCIVGILRATDIANAGGGGESIAIGYYDVSEISEEELTNVGGMRIYIGMYEDAISENFGRVIDTIDGKLKFV